jgi:hypothetical protein
MPVTLRRSVAIPVQALAWLGGQGTRAIAALVFIGIAVPPIGQLLKPFVTEAIFLLLCISFMRVDVGRLRDHLRRPGIVLAATAWTTLGVPLISGVTCLATGLDTHAPGLFLALMLQAVASPMMAAPALAALMGLDSTLVLVTLVTSTALIPITAPLFAYAFFGTALTLSPLWLGLKLVAILAGSLLVAAGIRWTVGASAIKRHAAAIDGLNILILFVFVAAVMGSVVGSFLADPVSMIELTVLAFAVFLALLGITTLIFRKIGQERGVRPRFDGLTAQHGTDAGRDGRRIAGNDMVVFRTESVPDLSVAATTQTHRQENECAENRACCRSRRRMSQ